MWQGIKIKNKYQIVDSYSGNVLMEVDLSQLTLTNLTDVEIMQRIVEFVNFELFKGDE